MTVNRLSTVCGRGRREKPCSSFPHARTPFLVVMVAGLLNLVLDPILMFNMGMGMAGAAWATAISQFVGAGIFLVIIARRKAQFGIEEALAGATRSGGDDRGGRAESGADATSSAPVSGLATPPPPQNFLSR